MLSKKLIHICLQNVYKIRCLQGNNMKKTALLLTLLTLATYANEKTTLTTEYLVGKWCFLYLGTPDKIENVNWEFKEDGKFMMQQSKHSSKIKHSGYWEIEDEKLGIKPVYMGGPKEVKIISQDEFTFKFFLELHIKRGACQ